MVAIVAQLRPNIAYLKNLWVVEGHGRLTQITGFGGVEQGQRLPPVEAHSDEVLHNGGIIAHLYHIGMSLPICWGLISGGLSH